VREKLPENARVARTWRHFGATCLATGTGGDGTRCTIDIVVVDVGEKGNGPVPRVLFRLIFNREVLIIIIIIINGKYEFENAN